MWVLKKFFFISVLSALIATSVVSYTSWWQIQNLGWLRALIYLDDSKENPCEKRYQGYGRLYKDGCFVNPVSVVQSVGDVIDKVHRGLTISEENKSDLLKATNFLTEWAVEKTSSDNKGYLLAPYNFSWATYNLDAGWVSGMAQGHVIEAMVAAYEVTGNKSYLSAAEEFANAFFVSVDDGGVTVWTDYGPWFEEYAQVGKEPSFALNGHIFAIEGLYRLGHYSYEYKKLAYEAVTTTEKMIDYFSTGWWSKYDLQGTMANQKYHHVHIRQLHWLGIEFGSEKLDEASQGFLWSQFYPFTSIMRIVYSPTRFLAFLLFLNFIIFFVAFYCAIHLAKYYKATRENK